MVKEELEYYHPSLPQDSLLLSIQRMGRDTVLVPVPSPPGADGKRRRGGGGREENMDTDHCGYAWGAGEVDGYISLQIRMGVWGGGIYGRVDGYTSLQVRMGEVVSQATPLIIYGGVW